MVKGRLFVPASVLLCAGSAVFGQVDTIDSALVTPRVFNDVPTSNAMIVNGYPFSIAMADQNVSQPSGFANRHVWEFSNDGGATAYRLGQDSFFDVWMDVTLTGSPDGPRKEAGIVVHSFITGDGQFIVNTDAHEVVAFGGVFPFYAFPLTYQSGDTLRMGMSYFLDTNTGLRSIVYHAGALSSPVLPCSNLEQGIIDGSTFGGYFQIVNDPNNPLNSGGASFGNISIRSPRPVPEAGGLAMSALGLMSVFGLRRRRV